MSQAVRYDASALQDAMEERIGQYETFKEQLAVLKEKMVAVTDLGEAFEGKAAERIKEFFKAQSVVVESWIQFVEQQIAFMRDVSAMANDRELGGKTTIDVPFLDAELQTVHARMTAMVIRQQKDLANILTSINDLISLQPYSTDAVEQSLEEAKQKRWDTVEAVEEYDHALVSEYAQSEESQMLITGLFDAMMNATSQNGEITPMSFNSQAFETSMPFQVKDEVQGRSMDYIKYKQEQQDVREAQAKQAELDARSGLEKFWDGTKTFVGEFSGYYDSQRASTGIDPVTGKELSTAERIAAGGMAAAGYIPIVGWLGRGAKAGKAIYSLNKGMDAVDTTLGVYKSTKSMTYVSQAEKGIYGLVAANGMSGYFLGQDLLGHKLTETERQESLMMAGFLPLGAARAVSGKMSGTFGVIDDVPKKKTPKDIIAERTKGLDLNAHPVKFKQLGPKKMSELKAKIDNRTITKVEYNNYVWNKKFKARRQQGVDNFWDMERDRVKLDAETTRNWTLEQREALLNNKRPKYEGKTLQGHHTYSASKYPHLADKGEIIYPATFNEHFRGWHGGNWKKSLPGEPIKKIEDY